ncbi:replicative DNA helicase [Pseudonocardia hispaniensis]|uniref:DNA 5'-3' helicase n=1 Tax=Pseudonocardia hispaniensis TaxID=904933 RepID=A0ABW1IWR5_9PSEU
MTETTELELRSDPAEQALIGAVAFHPDALAGVLASLPGSDFYTPARGVVWDACRQLSADRVPIDPVSVARHLTAQDGWTPAVQRVVRAEMTSASSAVHAVAQARVVADLARRRELLRAFNRARTVAADHPGSASDAKAAALATLDEISGDDDQRTGGTLGWSDLWDEFEAAHAPGGSAPGLPTPWYELDELIGGLYPGRLYTFGGRPGAGKSTAALNIAAHAAENARRVLVFSKEMPTVDVTGRILARGAQVDLRSINHRRLDDAAMARIRTYVAKIGELPIKVNASQVSLGGIKTLARAHHHRSGLDILVVDYLQLIHTDTPSRTREQEVAQVSRELKALAMELGVAVVVPAQLNRGPASRADARPTMSDLRDSGQIEQDSDAVVLLWHETTADGQPTGDVTFIVDKNRHGPRGEIKLRWHGGYGVIG